MGWLSSLFNFDSSSQRSRKGQVFNTTHDAFSLPTSSPIFPTHHPDAFNPDTLATPNPDSARSATYTYPPQGPPTYGFTPTTSAFGSRPTSSSLLPTHMDQLHTPFSVSTNYPPLAKSWARLHSWLSREYPELGDTLNYGILPQDLAQIEMQFGFALPAVVRESYLCVDGQEAESSAGCAEGLFFGLTLLPLESVLEEWRFWREVDNDPSTGANQALRQSMQSLPPGWIRKEYSQRGWIPLIADKAGNYLGVDLNPAESGSVGQVIVFGRDFDTKVVLWNGDGMTGWARWLSSFVDELESGEGFEFGSADTSEDSEDEVGYGSYFYDGNGRGQGDSGGDVGLGLRYTGEYRGWNVLEAWADRSLRKWHEEGVITDAALAPIEEKPEHSTDLDIVELAMQGPGTEVAIPVLRNSTDDIPSPTVAVLKSHSSQPDSRYASTSSRAPLPTISVTKAPVPMPVSLPTASDIAPSTSPTDSVQFDDDIESARLRESEDIGLVTATRKTRTGKSPIRRETSEGSASALALSPSLPQDDVAPIPSSSSFPDLLADGPLEILETPTQNKTDPTGLPDREEDANPDTTIRLVGGGGLAGISIPVTEEPATIEIPEPVAPVADTDAISIKSLASTEAGKKDEKVHKKSKSSLALKRISQLGGLRKADSTSKDALPSPAK